jgi:hypothetical protein
MRVAGADLNIELPEDSRRDSRMATTRTTSWAWTGWVIFAASLLLITGVINIIEGLVALFDDKRLVIAKGQLIAVDLTGWGWAILIFGALMVLTGLGLLAAQTWARITAIVLAGLHAIGNVATLGAYPVWSLLMIGLDVVLLYALTARWTEARADLDPYAARGDRPGQHSTVE